MTKSTERRNTPCTTARRAFTNNSSRWIGPRWQDCRCHATIVILSNFFHVRIVKCRAGKVSVANNKSIKVTVIGQQYRSCTSGRSIDRKSEMGLVILRNLPSCKLVCYSGSRPTHTIVSMDTPWDDVHDTETAWKDAREAEWTKMSDEFQNVC